MVKKRKSNLISSYIQHGGNLFFAPFLSGLASMNDPLKFIFLSFYEVSLSNPRALSDCVGEHLCVCIGAGDVNTSKAISLYQSVVF